MRLLLGGCFAGSDEPRPPTTLEEPPVAPRLFTSAVVRRFGLPDSTSAAAPILLRKPAAITEFSDRSLWILDQDWRRILVYDSLGNYLRTVGGPNDTPWRAMRRPRALANNGIDFIFVFDFTSRTVLLLDSYGQSTAARPYNHSPLLTTLYDRGRILALHASLVMDSPRVSVLNPKSGAQIPVTIPLTSLAQAYQLVVEGIDRRRRQLTRRDPEARLFGLVLSSKHPCSAWRGVVPSIYAANALPAASAERYFNRLLRRSRAFNRKRSTLAPAARAFELRRRSWRAT